MYIIVGLGNPGKQYEQTRHNMGFITIDQLAEKHSISVTKLKHKALVGEGYFGTKKVMLVKPQTYMNLSGQSVREIMAYYKEDIEHLMVVYDDIDLEPGALRIRAKGSAGTHNGMRSILYDLQEDGFPRIRLGIGKNPQIPLDKYVLGGFTKEEKPLLEEAVTKAVQALECWVDSGINAAMNAYNTKAEKKKKPAGEDAKKEPVKAEETNEQ
ncbi:MAG: aminoacyl-tRNA hydrolase [Firmicutes bacterium]|nr:aminoacyl-tRNA hydrolase [Bacillota bacterium]